MFTKNSTIREVMQKSKKAETVLQGFGMHCLYCPMSQAETIEEACNAHGIDVNLMLEKLNKK